MTRKKYKILGMHCSSCAIIIEGDLDDAGIKSSSCNYARQELEVEFDETIFSEENIIEIVVKNGYRVE